MTYVFDSFELDTERRELRCDGISRHVEPQVFSLIELLVANSHRIVSKDEINEVVWKGRIVSEAVLNSRIRSARIALNDNGRDQRIIKTHSRMGFRALCDVSLVVNPQLSQTAAVAPEQSQPTTKHIGGKPTLAVMPFQTQGDHKQATLLATAVPHELITELSRLRWLQVISRSSSFKLDPTARTAIEIGQVLKVKYCLFGVLEATPGRINFHVEVANTSDGGIVWSESFSGNDEDIQDLRQTIVQKVTSQLDIYVPANEAKIAKSRPVENLDAWGACHIGLFHLYRAAPDEIKSAAESFTRAVSLDPEFALAHAGLAMTECANAFGAADGDFAKHRQQAIDFARRSLELDALDPFGNLAMGRATYMTGDIGGSADWFNHALKLRPNYAIALYSLSATDCLFGEGEIGQKNADTAMAISPIDPYMSTILTSRCVSHLVRGQYQEACVWADKVRNSANANPRFHLMVAASYALAEDREKATTSVEYLKSIFPGIGQSALLRSFPFRDQTLSTTIYNALTKYGF